MIRYLLGKGLDRIAKRGRPDPDDDRPVFEERLRALFDEYGAQIRRDEESPPKVWIFHRSVDHEAFLQAAMAMVDEACQASYFAGATETLNLDRDDCSCTCKAHQKPACPLCLRVERCQVHSAFDPSRVSPRWRSENP